MKSESPARCWLSSSSSISTTAADAMTRNSFGLNWRASRRISRRMSWQTLRAVFTSPRPWHVGHGSQSRWASDSRVRFLVISTRPSCVKPLTVTRVRSRASCFFSSASTAAWCSSRAMSMKSMMMMPPRLRRRSCRAIACPASRLVLKIVSSKLRAPTKPPVLTSTVVSASVWSMIR